MNWVIFKRSFLLLNLLFFLSCGIKGDVKPLPEPEYKLSRIGNKVYLIPKNEKIVPEGFLKRKGFYVREEPGRFCFSVKHLEGKEELACVGGSPHKRPRLKLEVREEYVRVLFEEGGTYRVYPYEEELLPEPVKEVKGDSLSLERRLNPYRVAITMVVGGVESEPVVVEVPPRKPPKPPKPEHLRLVVKGDKLYLYWWTEEEKVGFLVFRNGKLLTRRPLRNNVFVDRVPEGEAVYEVRSVNEFGVESEPARIIYRP
ncbi:hypothetical protein [Hydrogenivirga sp. 128-5-R1-1]|uniref:hypothetical protein n=1 Tax=Hydrogenivirga sp. 128-5-R1-1 TaxID=392423 RepID=UPI0012FAD0B6|nr:hypothetical protein [Hydrogenivirga sp. 128-5-R1-1]